MPDGVNTLSGRFIYAKQRAKVRACTRPWRMLVCPSWKNLVSKWISIRYIAQKSELKIVIIIQKFKNALTNEKDYSNIIT